MSLKKTWFSYVLWAVLAGLTGIITYVVTTKMLAILPVFALFIIFGIIGICFFLHFICGKIKQPVVSKWTGRIMHILLFLMITAAFIMMRLPELINFPVVELTEQAECFYKISMVGVQSVELSGEASLFEQIYIHILSGLFLFLGNKAEILCYFQMFLQSVSFLLLIAIGWTLQRRVYAWIPALFYAVSPFFFSAVGDVGPANFWFCVVLFVVSVICALEKVWKKRNITYITIMTVEILIGALFFFIKANVLLYGGTPFISGGFVKGTVGIRSIELLIVVVFLIFYCVSFWFNKQDHKTLYLLPFGLFLLFFVWLSFYEFDSAYFCMMFAVFNLYLITAESLRVIFTFKPEVVTGSIHMNKADADAADKEVSDFDWSEMKEIMQDNVTEEKTMVTEEMPSVMEELTVIDKTAPIENVLPMPKKHTPRVFDYAFEPSEDMMHYDVEIENDEYDY